MAEYKLILPEMGEGVMEATVIRWTKHEGDFITEEEEIVEVATDKVDSEIPSPCNGKIIKFLANEGDVVKIGEPLALIETEENNSEKEITTHKIENEVLPVLKEEIKQNGHIVFDNIEDYHPTFEKSEIFLSPLVKSIIQKEKISNKELEKINKSGLGKRITKDDVLAFLNSRKNESIDNLNIIPTDYGITQESEKTNLDINPLDEVIEIDRMRKLISNHMTLSKNTAVHVTSFIEADMTRIVKWRELNKNIYKQKEGENLTYTPIIVSAVVKAIQDFPMINISFDGTNIIKKKAINIGIATALPNGNLIVPVIKNADQLSLIELSRQINQLIFKARHNKLQPRDITEGTYTISNIGTFGNLIGTPIINQPQVAILAVGAIKKKPAVIETSEGDYIGIRHKMFLSHSYDHRIIDGMLGGSFVQKVAQYLEDFDMSAVI